MNVTVQQAADALREAGDFLILTHKRPDGDTTGCAGALCRGLRALGKTAFVLPNPDLTPRYGWLLEPLAAPEGFVPGYVVSTDVADTNMLPAGAEGYAGKVDLVIDHHRSNPGFGRLNLIRPEAGGCCEVIYDILAALGVALTPELAEPLYVGVSTDTGCFKFSNTTVHTHEVAAACLATGLDCGELNRRLFEVKRWQRFQMERIMVETMEFYHDGCIAVAQLRRADLDRVGATTDDLDSISGLPRQVEGVQAGLTLTENKDGSVRLSVRSTKEVDASSVCRKLGGGGHLRAGGASFPAGVGMEEAKRRALAATEEAYRESGL